MASPENIDINKDILENIFIDIDIDNGILQNIDIDKISYRLGFGISNTPTKLSLNLASPAIALNELNMFNWIVFFGQNWKRIRRGARMKHLTQSNPIELGQ